MKKLDGLVCGLIFAYCLVIVFFMFRPQIILADETIPVFPAPMAQTVVFDQNPDSPDPNQVFDLVNKERIAQGSPALTGNEKLAQVAAVRAADMTKRQYYAHKNPDGKLYYDLFPEYGITADYSCENLDIVFVPDITQFIDQWLASTKGHRNCMINPELKYGGYAVTKMTLLEYEGKEVPAYLVVAVHTTELH